MWPVDNTLFSLGQNMELQTFINFYLKIFFILTPFFVLSAFLSLTRDFQDVDKKRIAMRVTVAVMISSFTIYLFGKYIFELFGITLDAFRIGAGTILFLSALSMLSDTNDTVNQGNKHDIAVVPLALPMTVGPGVIGVLLVMGAEAGSLLEKCVIGVALFLAVVTVGIILYLATSVKRLIGRQGLVILPKITGLFVSAIAAQIIFTGIQNFLKLG
jgi:multiple antibiotic resistance protein